MTHYDDGLFNDDDDYNGCDEPRRKKRSFGCECFLPCEVSGTCPGPDNCPYANDTDDEGCEQ